MNSTPFSFHPRPCARACSVLILLAGRLIQRNRSLGLIFLPLGCLLLGGCGSPYSTDSAYNVLGRSQAFTSGAPTFVVGLEKRPREQAQWNAGDYLQYLREADHTTHPDASPRDLGKQNKLTAGLFDDSKVMVVTHVVKTENGRISDYLYNTYDPEAPPKPVYSECKLHRKESGERQTVPAGMDALEGLEETVKKAFDGGGFTHALVVCMGWANDQQESMLRSRMITDNLKAAAAQAGEDGTAGEFNPLVVTVTWPSQWWGLADSGAKRIAGHLFSYTNKSNDADEVGILIVNRLINHHLARAVPDTVPIVLIGHSLGARVLSRAYYSAGLLKERDADQRRPDLLLSLQPAYSARRWMSRKRLFELGTSAEGAPYLVPGEHRHFITSSRHDKANPLAFWSRHLGGKGGIKSAKERPDIFTLARWDEERKELIDFPEDTFAPVVIDAQAIVRPRGENSVDSLGLMVRSGHNDILDEQMGHLIYYLIDRAAGPRPPPN